LTDGLVVRGVEDLLNSPQVNLTIAVAPPHDKDRLRFLIEKLAELEVRRTVFLKTRFGDGRLPDPSKAASWAVAALEQSRGSRLMEIGSGWAEISQLMEQSGQVVFADQGGSKPPTPTPGDVTVAIGPEGGWAPDEIPPGAATIGLGRTVLRVETAAIVAAAIVLGLQPD
jgi:16S rRNA (uracil1498-N3)-methyltransferase